MPQRIALADPPEPKLRGYPLRRIVARIDDAAHLGGIEIGVSPAERRGHRFGRIARAPMIGVERPARLWQALQLGDAAAKIA